MLDVLVAGAGPAGAVAATILARAGARVRLVDRATFPRTKLCGDTVNPGTLALFRRLGLAADVERAGLRVDGMRVTDASGVQIEGPYPDGCHGRSLLRRDLDWMLLHDALAAGAEFESKVVVRRAIHHGSSIGGVVADGVRGERSIPARITIAADGRRSPLAFGLGLARHPPRPRRWAIGGYFEGVHWAETAATFGEMHLRRDRYIGVAPVPNGATNVCLVKTFDTDGDRLRDPAALLCEVARSDSQLRERFAGAHLVDRPVVLGPLAVDVDEPRVDGLLLAGDAAGFIDPLTGDGLRFAVLGAELAASAALDALEHGWTGVRGRLAEARRAAFASKWRFNRALRALVGSPVALSAAATGARLAPGIIRRVIEYAGDCRH